MPLFNYAYYSTIALKWDKAPPQTRAVEYLWHTSTS